MRLVTLLGATVLLGWSASLVMADEVVLSDGSKIQGDVVRESRSEVEVKLAQGSTIVPLDRVVRIVRKPTPEKELARRRQQLAVDDAKGRIELARFCLENRLPRAHAVSLALEAWTIDPKDPVIVALLSQRLDWKFQDEAWVEPNAWYPAHSYVRRLGDWVTLEQGTFAEAVDGLKAARSEEADAERALSDAQRELVSARYAEDAATTMLARVRAAGPEIDNRIELAQTNLAAAENDLTRASQLVTDGAGNSWYAGDVACAQRTRDAALERVRTLLAQKAELPRLLKQASTDLEAARARKVQADALLPIRRDAVAAARQKTGELELAEARARQAVAVRTTIELERSAERDAAARNVEPHPSTTSDAGK